jgi:hypothetical protein
MLRKISTLIVLSCLLTGAVMAGDKTPYKFAAFGNIYNTPGGANFHDPGYMKWMSDRFDMILNGSPSWLVDLRTGDTSMPYIWVGPYASSQEINLYETSGSDKQYAQRLADTAKHWQYIFARGYLLDHGVSEESLVVHIADNSATINQNGDGSRTMSGLQSLPFKKRRFTYQYWNNTPADTAFYPAGYTWLANGWCQDTRDAMAEAYYKAFIESPTKVGYPADPWNCFYMDNQGRSASFLSQYWQLTTSSGGAYADYLEFAERGGIRVRQNGGGVDINSARDYFDYSTLMIDSTIMARVEPHGVYGFANVVLGDYTALQITLPRVSGVSFESYLDYTKPWGTWASWLQTMDILQQFPNKYAFLEYRGDFLCSSTGWRSDTSRVVMLGYAFFLISRTDNTFFGPHELHQGDYGGNRRCWQKAFLVNLGAPDSTWRKIDSAGVGDWGSKTMVLYRSYGKNAVIMRTGYSTADYENDYQTINLHGLFREVDGWTADTSLTADSIFRLRPYEGKILVAASADPCDIPPTVPQLASPAAGASISTQPTLCLNNSSHGSCSSPVTYVFQIATDPGFAGVVRQSGYVGEGSGTTCFTTSAALDTGRRYYWRAKASNGTVESSWSGSRDFTTPNTPPGAPGLQSPPDQGTVTAVRPTLSAAKVTDPDGTSLVYYFQVSKFSNFSSLTASSGQVTESGGSFSWQVNVNLENQTTYYWRVRAYDGIAYSNWSSTGEFTVDVATVNNPPTTPGVYAPPDGGTIASEPVILRWNNSTDADGDQLTYDVEVGDSAGTTQIESATGLTQGGGGTTAFTLTEALTSGSWYRWRVRAFDGNEYSPWMSYAYFLFDSGSGPNTPPDPPLLISPQPSDTLTSLTVTLLAETSYDADGDEPVYEFAVFRGQTTKIDSVKNVAADGSGAVVAWMIEAPLSSGMTYSWTCRAFDGQDYSSWAQLRTFTVYDFSVDADEEIPTADGPLDGDRVKSNKPELSVRNILSGTGQNLYYFEVSEDETFLERIYSGPVEEESGLTTSWQVSRALKSGRVYYWRGRANQSAYSTVESFMVTAKVNISPNPYKPGKHGDYVTIHNMAPDGKFIVTTSANEVVAVVEGTSGGDVQWNVTNLDGRRLSSGVYLCYYRDSAVDEKLKLIVVK